MESPVTWLEVRLDAGSRSNMLETKLENGGFKSCLQRYVCGIFICVIPSNNIAENGQSLVSL